MDSLSTLFHEHKDVITQNAQFYARRHGRRLSYEEILSECYQAFLHASETYDAKQGKFRTLLTHYIRYYIRNWINGKGRKPKWEDIRSFDSDCPTFECDFDLDAFSADAADVVALALCPTHDIWQECYRLGGTKRALRDAIRIVLIRAGWSQKRVNRTFEEIREALQ